MGGPDPRLGRACVRTVPRVGRPRPRKGGPPPPDRPSPIAVRRRPRSVTHIVHPILGVVLATHVGTKGTARRPALVRGDIRPANTRPSRRLRPEGPPRQASDASAAACETTALRHDDKSLDHVATMATVTCQLLGRAVEEADRPDVVPTSTKTDGVGGLAGMMRVAVGTTPPLLAVETDARPRPV